MDGPTIPAALAGQTVMTDATHMAGAMPLATPTPSTSIAGRKDMADTATLATLADQADLAGTASLTDGPIHTSWRNPQERRGASTGGPTEALNTDWE